MEATTFDIDVAEMNPACTKSFGIYCDDIFGFGVLMLNSHIPENQVVHVTLHCGCKKEWPSKWQIPCKDDKCEHDNYFVKIGPCEDFNSI